MTTDHPGRPGPVRPPHAPAAATLRSFTEADIAAALALWRGLPGVGLTAEDAPAPLAAFLARNPGLSLVACADGQLVGTLLCGHDGRRGLLHHLAVDARWQRGGIGRRLLDHGLAALHQAGIAKAHLLVINGNHAAQAFWQHGGAQRRGDVALWSVGTAQAQVATQAPAAP